MMTTHCYVSADHSLMNVHQTCQTVTVTLCDDVVDLTVVCCVCRPSTEAYNTQGHVHAHIQQLLNSIGDKDQ